MSQATYGQPSYGMTRRLVGLSFEEGVARAREQFAKQGFGVLTEIDVQTTMKKKLGVELRNYVILGMCNPPLAHQALTAEPAIGLLLPCNVVVTEEDDGAVVVSALDPVRAFSLVGRPEVEPIAREVAAKLTAALDALGP